MSIMSAMNHRVFRAFFTALVAMVATLTTINVNAKPAEAADPTIQSCEMWALTDRVDYQGRMYGAGGINNCGRIARLTVYLYRNGVLVASRAISDCFTPCATSTSSVPIGGSYTWCTLARATTQGTTKNTSHCTVT